MPQPHISKPFVPRFKQRLTIQISDDQYRALLRHCDRFQETISSTLRRYITQGLIADQEHERAAAAAYEDTGLFAGLEEASRASER